MIFGYARVSTNDQTPQLQLDALKAAKCKRIFVDQASERSMNQPELVKCLTTVREGDTLVIWKLDRLGRSLKDLLEIVEHLRGEGVQLISLTEEINTKSASGELIFHIFTVLAQFERTLNSERTVAGMAAARARGRFGGAKIKPHLSRTSRCARSGIAASSPEPKLPNSSLFQSLPSGAGYGRVVLSSERQAVSCGPAAASGTRSV